MPHETLPALTAGRGEFLDAFLLQALAQLGFAPPLLPVTLLSLSKFAMKGAIVLARTGGEQVGNADIDANHRSIGFGLQRDYLVVGKRQPPPTVTLVEGDTRIDGLLFQHLTMIVG